MQSPAGWSKGLSRRRAWRGVHASGGSAQPMRQQLAASFDQEQQPRCMQARPCLLHAVRSTAHAAASSPRRHKHSSHLPLSKRPPRPRLHGQLHHPAVAARRYHRHQLRRRGAAVHQRLLRAAGVAGLLPLLRQAGGFEDGTGISRPFRWGRVVALTAQRSQDVWRALKLQHSIVALQPVGLRSRHVAYYAGAKRVNDARPLSPMPQVTNFERSPNSVFYWTLVPFAVFYVAFATLILPNVATLHPTWIAEKLVGGWGEGRPLTSRQPDPHAAASASAGHFAAPQTSLLVLPHEGDAPGAQHRHPAGAKSLPNTIHPARLPLRHRARAQRCPRACRAWSRSAPTGPTPCSSSWASSGARWPSASCSGARHARGWRSERALAVGQQGSCSFNTCWPGGSPR